jgi:hypothetical protein
MSAKLILDGGRPTVLYVANFGACRIRRCSGGATSSNFPSSFTTSRPTPYRQSVGVVCGERGGSTEATYVATAAAADDVMTEVAGRHRGVPRSGPGGCFVDHCDAHIDGATGSADGVGCSYASDIYPPTPPRPTHLHLLCGVTFAVKDNFDVAGYRTGAGNPTWLATHPLPAEFHAGPVKTLLAAGASLVAGAGMGEGVGAG